MNKPHKHCELIKAWADGAEIQFFDESTNLWKDTEEPFWHCDLKYRIKPQTIRYRVAIYKTNRFVTVTVDTDSQEKEIESRGGFVFWLTDWIEVEV